MFNQPWIREFLFQGNENIINLIQTVHANQLNIQALSNETLEDWVARKTDLDQIQMAQVFKMYEDEKDFVKHLHNIDNQNVLVYYNYFLDGMMMSY